MESSNCDLCNTRTKDFCATQCNHGTCNECFYKICIFNKNKIDSLKNQKVLDLKCMKCPTGRYNITKSEILQMLNSIASDKQTNDWETCSRHQKEMKIYCIQCRIQMCYECFEHHNAIPGFASHEQGKNLMANSSLIKICSTHNNLPSYHYCGDCNSSLCEICKYLHDKEHKINLIQDLYNNRKDEIKSEFKLFSYSLDELTKILDESDIRLKKDINKEVANLKDKINCIIDHLLQICQELDSTTHIVNTEIDMNKAINCHLFDKLTEDVETLLVSPATYLEDQSLLQIAKKYTLPEREITIEIITELTNKINKLFDEQKVTFNNKFIGISVNPTLTEHMEPINCLVQLKDGRLASGSWDYTIKIWDPEDHFNCTHTLTEHDNPVICLVKLKDGRLASGSWDYTIKIWDPEDNFNCTHTLTEHYNRVNCLVQLKDGRLASGSWDYSIKIWDPEDNFNCSITLTEHDNPVNCVVQLKDGRLASGSEDNRIKIWDTEDNFICTHTLTEHENHVNCLVQLKDGRLASGSEDNTIKIWDPEDDFRCIFTLLEHDNPVNCLVQLKDGRLASVSEDNTIKVWDAENNFVCTHTITEHDNPVNCLVKLKDGRLASGSRDNTIKIWNLS